MGLKQSIKRYNFILVVDYINHFLKFNLYSTQTFKDMYLLFLHPVGGGSTSRQP